MLGTALLTDTELLMRRRDGLTSILWASLSVESSSSCAAVRSYIISWCSFSSNCVLEMRNPLMYRHTGHFSSSDMPHRAISLGFAQNLQVQRRHPQLLSPSLCALSRAAANPVSAAASMVGFELTTVTARCQSVYATPSHFEACLPPSLAFCAAASLAAFSIFFCCRLVVFVSVRRGSSISND